MKMNLKKWIATISIYEVILITYVIILKPFGRRMYSQDWEIFWTWFFIPPIAFTLIILIIIWSKGEKIKFDVLKDFKFSKKNTKFSLKKFFKDFYYGDLSLPLSFWGFGFLGSIIVGFVGGLIFQHVIPARLLAVPWQLFAAIGIWAAADKYKGKKIFSVLSKIFIVIWIINNIGKLIYLAN
tara:strand:- start:47 stop:592 length:546 start_codon:yes stop_codon:yes gene_type:complete